MAVTQHAIDHGLIRPGTSPTRAGDVELKFAIRLRAFWRRTGVAPKETIVINHPAGPCKGKLGCDGLLNQYHRVEN